MNESFHDMVMSNPIANTSRTGIQYDYLGTQELSAKWNGLTDRQSNANTHSIFKCIS